MESWGYRIFLMKNRGVTKIIRTGWSQSLLKILSNETVNCKMQNQRYACWELLVGAEGEGSIQFLIIKRGGGSQNIAKVLSEINDPLFQRNSDPLHELQTLYAITE